MPIDTLHSFRCKNCGTIATSPVWVQGDRQVTCNLCVSYMRHVWSEPIRTEQQRERAMRGVVYGPYEETPAK